MKNKNIDVVIISGQSNGVGCSQINCIGASMGEPKYNEYREGYENIKIAYDCWTKDFYNGDVVYYSQNKSEDNGFVKVALGQGNSKQTFGPEIGIAEAMHEKYGDQLFLIKFACGASNLKDDWASRNSIMYLYLVDYISQQMAKLKEMGYKPTLKAFCWMQGEGDSYNGYYQVYKENLELFVGNLREDFSEYTGGNELAFIDAGISSAEPWEFYQEVNDAKREFAAESDNNIFIDTIAAGMHTDREPFGAPDVYHYDSASEVLLGHLFAEAFEPFLEPVE